MGFFSISRLPPTRLLLASIALGFGGSFHFGFQLSSPNPTVNVFRRFLNESYNAHYESYLSDSAYRSLWSCMLTLQSLGCAVGSLMLVPTAEKLGRKKGFLFVSFMNVLGLSLQISALRLLSFEALAVGRFLVGVATGLVLGLQTMYLSEVSQKEHRGAVTGSTSVFLELGFGLGAAIALPDLLGTDTHWPNMYVVELILATFMWFALPFLPESPKYLVAKGNRHQALQALRFYQHTDPNRSMREIEQEVHSHTEMVKPLDLIRKPYLRRGLLLGFAVFCTANFSGILALDYFSTFLLIEVGLPPRAAEYATVAIVGQTVLAATLSSWIVDHVGRRPLLLISIVSMCVCNSLFLMFSVLYSKYQLPWLGYACIMVCILFTLTFGIGPSVLQWVINSEMTPQNARSPAQSFTFTMNRIMSILTSFAFFPLQGAVGAYSLLMFILPLPILFVIFYVFLPETKNRTTIEIMQSLGYEMRASEVEKAAEANRNSNSDNSDSGPEIISSTKILKVESVNSVSSATM